MTWHKTTPLVREAARAGEQEAQQAKSLGHITKERTLMAFVKTAEGQESVIADYGAKVHYQHNGIAIAEIPLSRINGMMTDSRILRIEANRSNTIHMDTTTALLGADRVHEGLALPKGYTGKGVVVGVQDIGFDLTHPTFWSRDFSRYRIKALWDQITPDTIGSMLPVGRDYRDSLSLITLGCPYDGKIQTHGTHTSSLAAGSGMEGPGMLYKYSGIAYDADIALVCNATTEDIELIPEEDYYKYTFALDALGFKYIFDYADSVGKPCVINFSEGSQQDFQGYDILYYEMLEDLVGPGHILVASAGNDGGKITYVHKPEGLGEASIQLNGSTNVSKDNPSRAVITTKSNGNFTITITMSDDKRSYTLADILSAPDSCLIDSVSHERMQYIIKAEAYPSCYNPSEICVDWIFTQTPGVIGWPVSIAGEDSDVEMYPVSGYFSTALNSQKLTSDNTHSIGSPGSAPAVICVGATGYRTSFINVFGDTMVYNNGEHGQRTPFSSVGPTWDGRTKPDVMAPGQNIIAAYSSYYIENNPTASNRTSGIRLFDYGGRTYAWYSDAGTSMSAPVVTGIIALWLEAYPKLTPDDVKDIFAKTCTHYDASLEYPNNLYGYGEIDAYAGMQEVLKLAATGIEDVKTTEEHSNSIYTLDGRYLGTDTKRLPRGIYIIGGNKVVK